MSSRIFALLIVIAMAAGCAQQGSPTGGAKDEDPPVVEEAKPLNYSTNFDEDKFEVTFDEFIVLENVNQELVVSPPMKEKPTVKLRKKTIVVQLLDTLKENTTYTFNFGSAIKDLHEGNKLLNFEYVFSTGDELDSLSLRGTLKYAEDLSQPTEAVSILLYTDLRDSVPLLDIPRYVGRSDDSGVFSVNNLATNEYKVFALKDGNNNFLFDLPSEEIAFLDSSLLLSADFARKLFENDSTLTVADSTDTAIVADSMVVDSLAVAGPDYNAIYIDLMLFTEEVKTQYMMNDARDDRRMIQLVFAQPLSDSFRYRFIGPEAESGIEVLEDFSMKRDSVNLWLIDSVDYKKDTLFMELAYTVRDSLDLPVTQLDTLRFTFREKGSSSRRRRGDGDKIKKKKEKLKVTTMRNSGTQELNKHLRMELDLPIAQMNDSLISLFRIPDSVEFLHSFTLRKDPDIPTRGWLESEWESVMKYRLQLLPGALTSVYPLEHDTVDVKFTTRDSEYYGQILLNLEAVNNPVLVQLFSGENLIRELRVIEDGQYSFPFLLPKDYSFKFIHDLNDNGKWDTGKYLEKRQPEPVEIISKTITVRSNWDHEVNMVMRK